MIPIQPTNLIHYLGWSRLKRPSNLDNYFFMSWEDALWELLELYNIPAGATVLVPSFFCSDVVNNMADHGLTAVFYPVDTSFQTKPEVFMTYLKKYKPSVVVIFHAVGITNTLFSNAKKWLSALDSHTILIEDSVHRVVDPQKIILISDRHVVINSLRKVVPIQGSNLYGKNLKLSFNYKNYFLTLWYQIVVISWWILFQLCLSISTLPLGKNWKIGWNILAEKSMLIGYDIIGDSRLGAKGWPLFSLISSFLNIQKIKECKTQQVKIYNQMLKNIFNNSKFFQVDFSESDYGELRGYPLGLKILGADKIVAAIREAGLLLRFELNDSEWSQHNKVVYLPLGPHLKECDIITVSEIINHISDQN